MSPPSSHHNNSSLLATAVGRLVIAPPGDEESNPSKRFLSCFSMTSPCPSSRNPPWWNRRTRLERTLCALASVAAVMCASLVVALVYVGYNYQVTLDARLSPTANMLVKDGESNPNHLGSGSQDSSDTCLTSGCVKAAADFLRNMDTSVDPCQDFYRFSCGQWADSQVIADDRTSVSIFSLLQDDLNNKLRVLIEKAPDPSEPEFVLKMRYMYKSCMNLTAIEKVGNTPLATLLKDMGGWPVIEGDAWNEDKFDWLDTLIAYRKHGFSHDLFMDLSVTPDFRNNTRHVIDLDQASLGMPDRSYLLRGLNDSAVAGYYKLMVESSVMLGADRERAEREMLDALYFETILANVSFVISSFPTLFG